MPWGVRTDELVPDAKISGSLLKKGLDIPFTVGKAVCKFKTVVGLDAFHMRKLGMFPQEKKKKAYTPKPYQQMTYPGERIQVDVKVVPRRCIADPELRLFQ